MSETDTCQTWIREAVDVSVLLMLLGFLFCVGWCVICLLSEASLSFLGCLCLRGYSVPMFSFYPFPS